MAWPTLGPRTAKEQPYVQHWCTALQLIRLQRGRKTFLRTIKLEIVIPVYTDDHYDTGGNLAKA